MLLFTKLSFFITRVIGPEGYKLYWVFGILIILIILIYLYFKRTKVVAKPNIKIKVSTTKNETNQPIITITVENRADKSVQIKQPLLIFKNGNQERKFNLKSGRNSVYPYIINSNNAHKVVVNLEKFYYFDEQLQSFKTIEIQILDIYNKVIATKRIQ